MTTTPETSQDIEFLKKKLDMTTDPVVREKLHRQISLLEDAVVVYQLTSSMRVD
jgi:hypothetical protein